MTKLTIRKFLISSLPDEIKNGKKKHIKQAYLSISRKQEILIRQTDTQYSQFIRQGSILSFKEVEIPLNSTQFTSLWRHTKGKRILKTRYFLDYHEKVIEIDEYEDNLKGLFTATVSFSSLQEAYNFIPPSFFKEEITFDSRYKSKHLAVMNNSSIKTLLNRKKSNLIIGTLPFYKKGDEIKVVLVTTRNGKHWIFPKGHLEKEKSYTEVALMEAKEEAGIEGIIAGSPILLPYSNNGQIYNMLAFPIEIKRISKNWEESKERGRKKVLLKNAYRYSKKKGFHSGLKYIETLASLM